MKKEENENMLLALIALIIVSALMNYVELPNVFEHTIIVDRSTDWGTTTKSFFSN